MKAQVCKSIVVIFMIHFLLSCSGEREIGKLSVGGLKNVFINLSQEDEFDSATAIYYEIVNDTGEVILRKYHLIGTRHYESDLRNFTANSYDSIIYLTYMEANRVYAVYDLKSGKGYPHGLRHEDYEVQSRQGEILFNTIKSKNQHLVANWKD